MTVKNDVAKANQQNVQIAQEWLCEFGNRLNQGNIVATTNLFLEDGWWRDQVAFTWDLRTFHGASSISSALLATLSHTSPKGFQLEPDKVPILTKGGPHPSLLQAFLVFETAYGHGRGVVRLVPTGNGSWKAWTLLTSMEELTGFEEPRGTRRPLGPEQGNQLNRENWLDHRTKSQEYSDRDPQVLVIGAGQAGLCTAARLRMIGVDSLVVDRHQRIGDNWRERYARLVLHDPIWFDPMPYLAYPDHFPVFLPKDKLAGFLEYYAEALELNVWTNAEFLGANRHPTTGTWKARVLRKDGSEYLLKPRHIVVATGNQGIPYIPEFAGTENFRGTILHSTRYSGTKGWAGKRAVVIGTGTSGHDVAQDLCEHGVTTTLVQRSSTYVIDSATLTRIIFGNGGYHEGGPPIEDADLLSAATPNFLVSTLSRDLTEQATKADTELLKGLEAVGFRLNKGVNGGGIPSIGANQLGNFYFNVGASNLIAEGKIGIKPDAEIACFTENKLVFSDGSELEADIVVLATGFQGRHGTIQRWFGNEVANQIKPGTGLDDEGESLIGWRPSGQPGLWFAGGNFQACRYYSKLLAFQIKAIEEGFLGV